MVPGNPVSGASREDRPRARRCDNRSLRLILRFTFSSDVSTAEVSAGPMHPASSDALFG